MEKILVTVAIAVALSVNAADLRLDVGKPGAPVQPTMYGLFFEDINYAADGGLYAEMIKNRSFEFPQPFMGWDTFGNVTLRDDGPFDRNPHYVRLADPGHPHKRTGLVNKGFFGVSFKAGEEYRFSTWARVIEGKSSRIKVELIDPSTSGETQVIISKEIEITSPEWQKYTITMTPEVTVAKGELRIFLSKPSNTVDLEHISLFPVNTWNGHENGLRHDLAQALADLKPGVFRFPGGCIVEGTDLNSRYQWKNSVGPVENRPLNENRWHYTFPHRFFPDYFQSYGLGFYEYFVLSEEIGAEPLPILSVGLACQYQNNSEEAHVPVDSLQPYIQDALDLIDFANGSADSGWGKLRAEIGHPEPFNLKFIGIGNEQWGPEYTSRLQPFIKAIREAYPDIKIVGSSGPAPDDAKFDYLWPEMKRLGADLVDEHFYRPESWFLAQGTRYDNYDRKGPKVFAGEYACHGAGKKWNHFNAALLEAAFMTGLERNADIVHMATYAPLFAHVEGWQWRPDMIWFDNLSSVRTSSYLVQQLYGENKGTNVLRLTMDKKPLTGAEGQGGLFASAVLDAPKDDYIVKIANTSDESRDITITFDGLRKNEGITHVTTTTLTSPQPDIDNTISAPETIRPAVNVTQFNATSSYSTTLLPHSFSVMRFSKDNPQ